MRETKKQKIIRELVMFFLELGYIPDVKEYRQMSDVPVRSDHIRRWVGPWKRVRGIIQRKYPDEYAEIMSDKEPEEVITAETPKIIFPGEKK